MARPQNFGSVCFCLSVNDSIVNSVKITIRLLSSQIPRITIWTFPTQECKFQDRTDNETRRAFSFWHVKLTIYDLIFGLHSCSQLLDRSTIFLNVMEFLISRQVTGKLPLKTFLYFIYNCWVCVKRNSSSLNFWNPQPPFQSQLFYCNLTITCSCWSSFLLLNSQENTRNPSVIR